MFELEEIIEEWKDVADYNGKYIVSNKGRVAKLLKQSHDDGGYRIVGLLKREKNKTVNRTTKVHHLVFDNFDSRSRIGLTIDHIIEDKEINWINNLELKTLLDNLEEHNKNTVAPNKNKKTGLPRGVQRVRKYGDKQYIGQVYYKGTIFKTEYCTTAKEAGIACLELREFIYEAKETEREKIQWKKK